MLLGRIKLILLAVASIRERTEQRLKSKKPAGKSFTLNQIKETANKIKLISVNE